MMRLALIALLASGCTDLATPAELVRPQILAVRTDPPGIAEGGVSELSILIAGPDGVIDDAQVSWAVAEPTPELPAIGEIEIDADGVAWYIPPPVVGSPTFTTIEATVTVDDSPTLIALKGVGLGLNRSTANPAIAELIVNDDSVEDGDTVTLFKTQTAPLEVLTDPPITNDAIVSWYSTVGEIELFRRTPTEILAPDEPGEGTLIVTYRDEQGGVTWLTIHLVIQ